MAAKILLVASGWTYWVGRVSFAVGGLLWLLWALGALYLFVLALAALAFRKKLHAAQSQNRKFAVVIPAHNEELLIGDVLARLGSLDYPADLYSVVVIADNCTDGTADISRS